MIDKRFDTVRHGVIYHAYLEEIGIENPLIQLRVVVDAGDGRQFHVFRQYYHTERAAMKQLGNYFPGETVKWRLKEEQE